MSDKEVVKKVHPDAYCVYSVGENAHVIRATEGDVKFARLSPFPSTAGTPKAAWADAASRIPQSNRLTKEPKCAMTSRKHDRSPNP